MAGSQAVVALIVSLVVEVAQSGFLVVALNVTMGVDQNASPEEGQHACPVVADQFEFREDQHASFEVGLYELVEVVAQYSVEDLSVCSVVVALNAEVAHQAAPSVLVEFQPSRLHVSEVEGLQGVPSVAAHSSGGVPESD